MIRNGRRDPRTADGSLTDVNIAAQQQVDAIDRGPQLLRLLTLLARFGMDPMAPALLEPQCAAPT